MNPYKMINESLKGLLPVENLELFISINDVTVDVGEDQVSAKNIELSKKNERAKLTIEWVELSRKVMIRDLLTSVNIDAKNMGLELEGKVDLENQPTLLANLSMKNYRLDSNRPISIRSEVRGSLVKDGASVSIPCAIEILPSGSENLHCQWATDLVKSLDLQRASSFPLKIDVGCRQRDCELNLVVENVLRGEMAIAAKASSRWQEGRAQFEVLDFSGLSAVLDRLGFGVPVPFSRSQGSIKLSTTFSHRSLKEWKVPLKTQTKLKSKNQAIYFKASSFLEIKPEKTQLDAKVEIEKLFLVLPSLSLGPFPALSGDSRIDVGRQPDVSGDAQDEGAIGLPEDNKRFDYNINVSTLEKGAIKVFSEKLKQPLSLSSELQMSSRHSMQGWLAVEETELEVLKRQATVRTLKVNIAENFSESPIQGLIKIQQGIYDISVILRGSVADPVVRLESDPILSEGEIVSVLLYGHKSSELDGESDVADAKSKIASRSLGLVSLYVFSATPIDSILYNAEEKSVTANMSVAGNRISVTEQNSSVKSVGVERRIYGNIFLRSHREFGEDSSTTTTLEWEKRY